MARITKYLIDGENQYYPTLKAAKAHIELAYTLAEKIKSFYQDEACILGIDSSGYVGTVTEIRCDKLGRISFSRTIANE